MKHTYDTNTGLKCACGKELKSLRQGFASCECGKDYVLKGGKPFQIQIKSITADKVEYDLLETVDDFSV